MQQIDLMELTHHSNDHINGILGYVGEHKDDNPFPVRKLWVNCARQIDIAQGGNLSASQASDLADALAEIQKTSPIIWKDKIVEGMDTSDIKFADVDDIAIFLYSFLYFVLQRLYSLLQKPYVMHNLFGKFFIVVMDDSGGKIAILHR